MSILPTEITQETFQTILTRYGDHVDAKLSDLDEKRYKTIGVQLHQRDPPMLLKSELNSLVEWKLRHGTWRPSLAKLAESNEEEHVAERSKVAFSRIAHNGSQVSDVASALNELTKLRGIGPATASLLLSCCSPGRVPFFSDELFRWLHWTDEATKGTRGWERKIAYTTKEYNSLLVRARALFERLEENIEDRSVWMLEAEKVAFVLGKEGFDCNEQHHKQIDDQPITLLVEKNLKRRAPEQLVDKFKSPASQLMHSNVATEETSIEKPVRRSKRVRQMES